MTALTDLSSKLSTVNKQFAASVRKQVRAGVEEAGAATVARVRSAAGWSSRIPGAVKLTTRFSTRGASIRIIVDHRAAPHARPLEVGNKNVFALSAINALGGYKTVNGRKVAVNRSAYAAIKKTGIGLSRGLRHPVFDSGHPPTRVGEQATRPFFFPAIAASKAGIDQRMEDVVIRTAKEAGFK
jgi:hypothetical protein